MKYRKLFYILMFLPLIISLVFLNFLPDKIPAHYNIHNEVDRWGSKYETLILPIVSIGFGIFSIAMSNIAKKQEQHGKNNENIGMILGICTLPIFSILSLYFTYTAFNKIENLSVMPFSIEQIIFFALGILLLVSGNLMPKLKRNNVIGFRTKQTMRNDCIWKKSQRFAGISLMISGIVITVSSLFFKGILLLIIFITTILVSLVADIIYSHKIVDK